jgi:hypothetical protein
MALTIKTRTSQVNIPVYNNDITQQELKEVLHYDPNTGIFTRLTRKGGQKIGSVAGHKRPDGYTQIKIDGKRYLAHRLAWLYMTGNWPSEFIDHIDRNPSNNRFDNLRESTNQENQQNTNCKGYSWNKRHQKWMAQIRVNGKQKNLGYYNKPEEAREAYIKAKAKLHQFNPTTRY